MADNQYSRYLEDQQNRQGSSALGQLATFGGVVGAGALGYRFRREIGAGARFVGRTASATTMAGVSKFARSAKMQEKMRMAGAYGKALDEALDFSNQSIFGALTNPGRFNDRFEKSFTRNLQDVGRRKQGPLKGLSTQIEEAFFSMKSDWRTSQTIYAHAKRRELVMQDIRAKMPGDEFTNKILNNLEEVLNNTGDKFFTDPHEDKIKSLLDKYSKRTSLKDGTINRLDVPEDKREQFIQDVLGSVQKYSNIKSPGGVTTNGRGANGEPVGGKKLRNLQFEGFIKNFQKPDDFQAKMMEAAGLRYVTVNDAMERGLWEADSIRTPGKNGSHRNARIGEKIGMLAKGKDERIGNLILDRNLLMDKDGNLVDMREMASAGNKFMEGFRDNFHIPFLRFNPLDLLHYSSFESMRSAPKNYFLRRGTIDPFLSDKAETQRHPMSHNQDAAVGMLAKDYMFSGGNVYDVLSGDLIKENVQLVSARFGLFPRVSSSMANLHTKDLRDRGFLKTLFDVGGQETQSILGRVKTIATKFDDPDWERNTISILRGGEAPRLLNSEDGSGLSVEGAYKNLYSMLEQKATMLSDDTVAYLNPFAKQAYGDIGIDLTKLNTAEEVMDAVNKLSINQNKIGGSKELKKLISETAMQYESNPTEFLKNKRILSDDATYAPEFASVFDQHETHLVSKIDDVKRLVHMHAISQIEEASGSTVTVGSLIKQGFQNGQLGSGVSLNPLAEQNKFLGEVRDLNNLSMMRQWWDNVYSGSPETKEAALKHFEKNVIKNKDNIATSLTQSAKDFNGLLSLGPGQKPPQPFGYVGWQTINEAKGYQWAMTNYNKMVADGENPLKAGVMSALEVLGQPFAGRHNMENVTTATAFFYQLAGRLDDAFAKVGLGLSQQNRGSMQSIMLNQFGRRIVLPYVAYEQAKWLDGMTGDFFSDKAADAYANMHQDVGFAKEILGLNKIGEQWGGVFAGADQIKSWTPVHAFNTATFGALSDSRSSEEIREYYESGEDPIRRGRFWAIGSSTPWMGGKIDRYEPNWYRKLKSDYKFTDTMYGSEGEYWANHWMPTLTNPAAPLKHFIFDANHWEEEHMEDRPYPITGGIPELQMVPIVGPVLDNTIGRILKPRTTHPELHKSHRAYIEEINNIISSQYDQANAGGMVEFMPAGGYEMLGGGYSGGTITDLGAGTGGGYGSAVGGGAGAGGASGAVRSNLAAMNQSLVNGGSPTRSISSLDSLRDPDIVANLYDIGTMGSLPGMMRDSFYSLSEIAGIYGFSTKWFSGFEESGRGMTLEPSSRMTSYARQWWDLEMGGLGGDLSEIGRRYNPRDPNKNYWNPIRNKMPEWMPGPEYFTDFRHGDPYVKVAHGEMRLPGEAYETLHKLHPDAFGEYGAFDRFKILADVAPYSEQYRFYRKVMSQMNQAGMMSEDMQNEYAEIRDQVSSRKSKYTFYDRRFGNADVIDDTVTITRMIDATTFLTREYGNNPIKMAAVDIKADDAEAQEWLSQYIYEGAKVKVSLDADPLHRVRDDTMETMRAVVYANKNEEMMPFYMSTKGQNLNFMLANRSFGGFMGIGGENNVSVHDDGSATSTRALYSNDMVTVGKLWEFLTHDVLSNVPIVNTIADKFLNVKSPLETYKHLQVYGKEWRPWNEPWSGWLQPMFEKMAAEHPLMATAQGAGMGWAFTRTTRAKRYGMLVGGMVGGLLAATRTFDESAGRLIPGEDDYTWIPERRRKEREIDEYFDKLKYIKYKGLYEKTRQLALKEEGVDIETILSEQDLRGQENKSKRRFLETSKKWLAISKKLGYGDEEAVKEGLSRIRDNLEGIDGDRSIHQLGPKAMLALRYRSEYESTLHGADPYGDMQQIFRALPSKDREFFTRFMNAAPDEREEILRLVPENQRKFYQARWGLKVDKDTSLGQFFTDHYLPDESWEGWRPTSSLENYKVKVVKKAGLEPTEFGLWGDDEKRAQQSGAEALDIQGMSHLIDVTRLEKALRGAGLSNVQVSMTTAKSNENKLDVAMNIMRDRRDEIVNELNSNLASIFS